MKKIILILLAAALLLGGCSLQPKQHSVTYLNLFDTVTTILGSGGSEDDFQQNATNIYNQLYRYHQLFDIYNDYDGIPNLKTVNDRAGIAPVKVDPAIIGLLLDCKTYYQLTGGKVNAAMGSVLRLWHEARASEQLPDSHDLAYAAAHTDFDNIIIDEAASTVYISDPNLSLDVGAIAKGWAVQQVAKDAPSGLLISVGGNVCATGPKADGSNWVIGIQNPDGGDYLATVSISGGSVVTSGDYQRFFTVDGVNYHHIIDPETLMPSAYWCSVTVICADSGLADALSTALFLLPLDEGQALAEQCGAQALWVDATGQEFTTPSFQ